MVLKSVCRYRFLRCFAERLSWRDQRSSAAAHLNATRCLAFSCPKRNSESILTLSDIRERLNEISGAQQVYGKGGYDRSHLMVNLPKSQEALTPKRMKDSYSEGLIPLASNIEGSEKYFNAAKEIRFGRILEDLDHFAVYVGYKHCEEPAYQGKSPLVIVTGLVDKIRIHGHIFTDLDMKICGNVSWAGRTSMEVTMVLEQNQSKVTKKLLEARFVLVARDPINAGSAFINPLKADTVEEEQIIKLGDENIMKRRHEAKESLLLTAPDEKERILIHDLFLETIDPKGVSFKANINPINSVWLSTTNLKNLIICHPQERNMYNKIFGGFLMRQAYELGWANAFIFSQASVEHYQVARIIFRNPVEIGDLLLFSSKVVYVENRYIQVRVHAQNVDPIAGTRKTTNIFNFTFRSTRKDLPRVVPQTYAEAMMYLDGKRIFQR